jgi:glyoxylase-like metal-dependent hydrolase (beta-lactamase superfamily II)
MRVHRVSRDVSVISDQLPVPGLGFLPVNAYVLRAAEPVVIDTGLSLPDRGFMDALGSVVDPQDVRWIWLTHPDRDHTGALFDLLDAAPRARLATTFVSAGMMSAQWQLPMDRLYLVRPGERFDVGDRVLTAFRPPVFDSPATLGFYDERSRACISSDCFGAPMPSPDLAEASDAGAYPPGDLHAGQVLWATVDSPWVHGADRGKYLGSLQSLRSMDPSFVLSSHLPPASGRFAAFLDALADAPGAEPFTGPCQQELEEMLAGSHPGGTPAGPPREC